MCRERAGSLQGPCPPLTRELKKAAPAQGRLCFGRVPGPRRIATPAGLSAPADEHSVCRTRSDEGGLAVRRPTRPFLRAWTGCARWPRAGFGAAAARPGRAPRSQARARSRRSPRSSPAPPSVMLMEIFRRSLSTTSVRTKPGRRKPVDHLGDRRRLDRQRRSRPRPSSSCRARRAASAAHPGPG